MTATLTDRFNRAVDRYMRGNRPAPVARYSWDESKHPRAADGKFGSGPGSSRKLSSHARMLEAAKSGQGATDAAIEHVMEVRAAAIQEAIPIVAKRLAEAARAELGDDAPDDLQQGFEQALRDDPEIIGARFDLDGVYPEDHFTEDESGNVTGVDEESMAAAIDEAVRAAMKRLEGRAGLSKVERSLVRDHVREIRAESKPKEKPLPAEKPKVAGTQGGLFDKEELTTGQKTLFNVVRPEKGGKKSIAPDLLASVTAEVRDILARKDTISPADIAGTAKQAESIEGQKDLFSRVNSAVDRYLKSNKI
ncbi:MAG: hypothetical protein IT428_31475 [Planctomycetaceae bacterium]|nr:hypothetical protein [Planctomycetaceae bacterium]